MKCQQCKVNQATVNMAVQLNNEQHQLQVCHECFEEIKQQMNPSNFFQQGGNMKDHPFFQGNMGGQGQHTNRTQTKQQEKGNRDLLDELGSNVTNAARNGNVDRVIGRDQEVKRVIETLNRRNKNNPVLIGEPGVGKTAIAEGLALKIVEGDVPTKLLNKEVYILDVASLVANTGIRGQFEERMKNLMKEVQENPDVILFIDELHLLVGAGTSEGSQMDAGNILKPALARGELQMIGATTLKEYRQIEKDGALERRFQPITVKEPTAREAVLILQGIKDRYEEFHGVTYPDEVIEAFVTLSSRYIQDRFLPDKAIDLMDEIGSRLNLAHAETDAASLEEQLEKVVAEKEAAAEKEAYEDAANLRYQELQLQKQLEKAQDQSEKEKVSTVVTVNSVEEIVEEKTGIPVMKLQADEQENLKNFAEHLRVNIIGQDKAVDHIAKAIRRSRAGLKSKYRPIGSFLFVGPTGVGKTELSKVLAEELFGSREALVRLDMSEYMERHSVSKIIGSPPGYVGHEEAGQLTEKIRRNPYSIILLDEIEKAHPDVQNMFLQIMEDGHLTDSHGRTVSFKDTVIIMTSNAGSGFKPISVGFEKQNDAITNLDMLSDYFKPEFLNRFDSIIRFNALEEADLLKIVDVMLRELTATIENEAIQIAVSDEAKEQIVKLGYDPRFGARPLRRIIQDEIENQLTDLILENVDVKQVEVVLENEEIVVKTV